MARAIPSATNCDTAARACWRISRVTCGSDRLVLLGAGLHRLRGEPGSRVTEPLYVGKSDIDPRYRADDLAQSDKHLVVDPLRRQEGVEHGPVRGHSPGGGFVERGPEPAYCLLGLGYRHDKRSLRWFHGYSF